MPHALARAGRMRPRDAFNYIARAGSGPLAAWQAALAPPWTPAVASTQIRTFVDSMRVHVYGGRGGDGCSSFHRDKGMPMGPPDGGSGGAGGSVFLVGTNEESSLRHLGPIYRGAPGTSGQGGHKHGIVAKPIYVPVPLGTTIKRAPDAEYQPDWEAPSFAELSEEQLEALLAKYLRLAGNYMPLEDRQKLIWDKVRGRIREERARLDAEWTSVDILAPGEPVLVARGGAGGRGNTYFASREIPGPRFSERGYPGDAFVLDLEFKTISDVGLVGLPNAGKSSFICAVTNAASKIAAYPFTTLTPYIAAIDYPDTHQVKIVDIPGLIRGAHKGIGLGRSFLKHLERAKVLAYVVDVSGARPWDDLNLLRDEIRSYDRNMVLRPSIVIANKADVMPIARTNFEELVRVAGCDVVPVSSKYHRNLEEAAFKIRRMVEDETKRV